MKDQLTLIILSLTSLSGWGGTFWQYWLNRQKMRNENVKDQTAITAADLENIKDMYDIATKINKDLKDQLAELIKNNQEAREKIREIEAYWEGHVKALQKRHKEAIEEIIATTNAEVQKIKSYFNINCGDCPVKPDFEQ